MGDEREMLEPLVVRCPLGGVGPARRFEGDEFDDLLSDCDVDGWLAPCRERGLAVLLVASRDLGNEVLLIYRISPRPREEGTP